MSENFPDQKNAEPAAPSRGAAPLPARTIALIASIEAVLILGENLTINLAVASIAILGGVGVVIRGRALQK